MKKKKFFFLLASIVATLFLHTTVYANSCNGSPIPNPIITSVTQGALPGEVVLHWNNFSSVDHYVLIYGNSSTKYQYGALNIASGKDTSYTVRQLQPGKKYYFRIAGVAGCAV